LTELGFESSWVALTSFPLQNLQHLWMDGGGSRQDGMRRQEEVLTTMQIGGDRAGLLGDQRAGSQMSFPVGYFDFFFPIASRNARKPAGGNIIIP